MTPIVEFIVCCMFCCYDYYCSDVHPLLAQVHFAHWLPIQSLWYGRTEGLIFVMTRDLYLLCPSNGISVYLFVWKGHFGCVPYAQHAALIIPPSP